MVDHPEMIRQQMEETRSKLADKLEALENQVSDTVQSTTAAVTETVEAVKDTVESVSATVQETVETVGQTFDLWGQTDRHPWVVFGGSVALGYLAAQLFDRASANGKEKHGPSPSWDALAKSAQHPREEAPRQSPEPSVPPADRSESSENGKKSWFWDEMNRVKKLAVGSLMGVVRDLAATGLPGPLGQRVAEEVDHLTPSLGGETIRGPVLPSEK
jgi:hypothetical protein